MRRLLHVIHAAKHISSSCVVLSLDAEKAFDRLEWEYLWKVLHHFQLDSNFINLAKLLYSNPSAMINTNAIISNKDTLSRLCRQGCPLSPFLFILSLEPLAQKVRQHPSIAPITFNNTTHSILLYTDDILLFFDRAVASIPHILDTFDKFSSLPSYKINWTKSVLFPLNSNLDATLLPQHIPVVKQFKYLGVDIFPSLASIANKYFLGINNKIETDLDRLSLPLPTDYWKKVHSLVSKFIWGDKQPRVKLATLHRHKIDGGLFWTIFEHYFWSFVLRPLSDWLNPDSAACWKPIESYLASPHRLVDLIYSNVPLKQGKL